MDNTKLIDQLFEPLDLQATRKLIATPDFVLSVSDIESIQQTDRLGHRFSNADLCLPHIVVMMHNLRALDWFLENNQELLAAEDVNGYNIAHTAAQEGNIDILNWVREKVPYLLDQHANYQTNLAHVGAMWGKTGVLDFVKEYSPDSLDRANGFGLNIVDLGAAAGATQVLDWVKDNRNYLLSVENSAPILRRAIQHGETSVVLWFTQNVAGASPVAAGILRKLAEGLGISQKVRNITRVAGTLNIAL